MQECILLESYRRSISLNFGFNRSFWYLGQLTARVDPIVSIMDRNTVVTGSDGRTNADAPNLITCSQREKILGACKPKNDLSVAPASNRSLPATPIGRFIVSGAGNWVAVVETSKLHRLGSHCDWRQHWVPDRRRGSDRRLHASILRLRGRGRPRTDWPRSRRPLGHGQRSVMTNCQRGA